MIVFLKKLIESKLDLIITVRSDILEQVKTHYNLTDVKVIYSRMYDKAIINGKYITNHFDIQMFISKLKKSL